MNGVRQLMRHTKVLVAIGISALAIVPTAPVLAANFGTGTYGACAYNTGCNITISVGSINAVAVDVTPSSGTRCTVQKDVVTVTTTNSAGYNLALQGNSSTSNLVSGSNTITPGSGSKTIPAALTAGKWGYRVDGIGGFGAGPTAAQSNVLVASTGTFAAVPSTAQAADVIKSTSTSAGSGDTTNVWYGVCVGGTQAPGSYSTSVTYTALTN